MVVQTVSRRKKQRRRNRRNRALRVLHPSAIGRINPFLAQCNGMRAPDSFGYPTGTGVLRNSLGVGTNAGGFGCAAFIPSLAQLAYSPGNVTGGTVSWAAGSNVAASQLSAMANLASVYRNVAYGIRITGDSSLTSASGHVWVAHVPLNLSTTAPYFDWPTTEQQLAAMPLAEKFSLVELCERPIIVPGKAFDDGIYRFRDVNKDYLQTNVGAESTLGWCAIIVYVTGAAVSSNPLNVETIQHVEYLHDGSTLYGFIDTIPGTYHPDVMEQNAMVEAASPIATIETAINTVEKVSVAVGSLLGRATSAAQAVVGAYASASNLMRGYGRMRAQGTSAFRVPLIEDVD